MDVEGKIDLVGDMIGTGDVSDSERAIVEIDRIKKTCEAWLRTLAEARREAESNVIDAWVEEEKSSVKIDGRTVYLSTVASPKLSTAALVDEGVPESEARDVVKSRLCLALKSDPSTEHLVRPNYHHQSLSSYLRECVDEFGEPQVPEHLQPYVSLETHTVVRSRGA